MQAPSIIATAMYLPNQLISRTELKHALGDRMSDQLVEAVDHLGVESLHSVVEDYPLYLAGKKKRRLSKSTACMASHATRQCIEQLAPSAPNVGMIIAITNTTDRPLPCLGYEIIALLPDLIPKNVQVLNLQSQGCSALLKAIELANQFLYMHPDKVALIVAAESHTAFIAPKLAARYQHFSELKTGFPADLSETQKLMQAFLFGDAACALALQYSDRGMQFHSFHHQTNLLMSDTELLTLNEGAARRPACWDFPSYTMSKKVPARGAVYAKACVEKLFSDTASGLTHTVDCDRIFIHTGSKKILDAICGVVRVPSQGPQTHSSYDTLKKMGNVSSCSIGAMIHENMGGDPSQNNMAIAFGAGFSATACGFRSH